MLGLGLAGCASPPQPVVGDSLCALRNQPRSSWRELPPSDPARIEALVARGVDSDTATMADTIGALDAFETLIEAEQRRDGAVAFLLSRQRLTETVLLATLDVQATLASIDCEGERADQLLSHINRIQARRDRNLSMMAVAFGGVAAVASGGLSLAGLGRAADIVSIVGGAAEAGAAGSLLFGSPTGRLQLRQNIIEELVRQPERGLVFPPRVWRYLTRRPAPGAPNAIDELMADWRANELLGQEADDPSLTLMIAADGVYDADALAQREVIVDQLDARVALMQRDLRAFLEAVVARPAPSAAPEMRAGATARRAR